MRDKLIKLIDEAINNEETSYSNIADYLLENDVIVPPVKVGDTVYYIDIIEKVVEDCMVYGFQFVNGKLQLLLDNGECKFVTSNWYATKEEAEKALKGGAK